MSDLQVEQRTDLKLPTPSDEAVARSVDTDFEVSVVMPCLNEAETVGLCAEKAIAALDVNNIRGEVVVVDNGSTDGSPAIASPPGARVVPHPLARHGNAYPKGVHK